MSLFGSELGLQWKLAGLAVASTLAIHATVIVYSRLAGGDNSVIHGDVEIDPELFPNVVGREQLRTAPGSGTSP